MQWLMDGQRCHPAVDHRGPTLDQGQCNIKGGGCQLATLSCCLFMETWYNGPVNRKPRGSSPARGGPRRGGAPACSARQEPVPCQGRVFSFRHLECACQRRRGHVMYPSLSAQEFVAKWQEGQRWTLT
jgi:hypothetical protein